MIVHFVLLFSVFAKRTQSFSRELLIWERLRHLNILPLLGIMTIDAFPCTVSEWMENGTMKTYLRAHPEANVFKLVRFYPVSLLSDAHKRRKGERCRKWTGVSTFERSNSFRPEGGACTLHGGAWSCTMLTMGHI